MIVMCISMDVLQNMVVDVKLIQIVRILHLKMHVYMIRKIGNVFGLMVIVN